MQLIREKENLRIEYERLVSKGLLEKYQQLCVDEKNEINKEFEQYLGTGGYLDIFRRTGLDNIIVADMFCFFVKAVFPAFCSSIITFEEFVKLKETESNV